MQGGELSATSRAEGLKEQNKFSRAKHIDKFTGEPTEAKKYEDEAMKIAVSASDVMFDAGAKSNE